MRIVRLAVLLVGAILVFQQSPVFSDGGCEGEDVALSAGEKQYMNSIAGRIKAALPGMKGYYPSVQINQAEDYFLDCDKKKYARHWNIVASYATQMTTDNIGNMEECTKIMAEAGSDDAAQMEAARRFAECMKGSGVGNASVKIVINQGGAFGGTGDQGSINLEVFKKYDLAGVDYAYQDGNGVIYICLGNWTVKEPPQWTERTLVAQIPPNKINMVANIIIIIEATNDKIKNEVLGQINIRAIKATLTR